ncbi:alpha/beta hydrolase-fold protein [Ruegeria sp.]|uniref:enterochelin esterase domain-containing protein n=1 Tax=Ruegeria sp. TaxID=1879320 RepID=UPI00231000F2|nr:alpha/beta hydrolase-fold protein [Ruegeria sp.]MDA7964903.1 DUF3327 domain-containing protein [Ruegeria sp.]
MPTMVSAPPSGLEEQLKTTPGTYVEGWLNCTTGSADLILCQDGQEDRVLLDSAQDLHSFRFVATGHALTLTIRKDAATQAELRITKVVTPEDQGTGTTGQECAAPISPRLQKVVQGHVSVATFWQDVMSVGTPMIEPDPEGCADHRLVTFLWRGKARNVRLVGGPAPDHVWMQRLTGTDVWFASFRVPLDLRLSYRLAPDVPDINASPRENRLALLAVAQADPMNRTPLFPHVNDPFAQWSLHDLRGQTRAAKQVLGRVSRDVTEHRIADPMLKSGRRIWLHRPTGFIPGAPGNVLQILFDGATYLHQLGLPCRIEQQVQDGCLPPIATVFVDAVSPHRRAEDLGCDDQFTQMLTGKILPFAYDWFGQDFDASRVVVAGSSFGGLAAAYTALVRPKQIGNFISLSGSFWWAPPGWEAISPYMASLPVDPGLRAVLTAGSYERARHEGDVGILESTAALAARLRAQGAGVQTRTYAGGHDYAIWAPALIEALETLFGPGARNNRRTGG